jgi:DNA-binding transcriptional ArsR family regulator
MAAERGAARPVLRRARPGIAARRRVLAPVPGFLDEPANADLLRLVNERARLGILSALAVNAQLSFAELKQSLRLTDGNLSVHARRLEDAGLIAASKSFRGRRPATHFALTAHGRHVFERYLEHMQALLRHVRGRPESP